MTQLLALAAALSVLSLSSSASVLTNRLQSHVWKVPRIENPAGFVRVVARHTVRVERAEGLRLHFHVTVLGRGNFLRLKYGGSVLKMDDAVLRGYGFATPYLNASSVELELVLAGGARSGGIFLREVEAPLMEASISPETICGSGDNRAPSRLKPFARMLRVATGAGGCTGTLISAACMVSAGHCTGTLNIAQFNVPASKPTGAPNYPRVEDQYPLEKIIGSQNGGAGNDWSVYRVRRNPVTGKLPGVTQGYVGVSTVPPKVGASLQITGYGMDRAEPVKNGAQQTHFASLTKVTTNPATLYHNVDTEPGNSGSTIIDRASGKVIGVHTHGGCSAEGGSNLGTALAHHAAFKKAIADCLAEP